MSGILDRIERLAAWRWPWWAWPAALLALALVSDAASVFFRPMGSEWVMFPSGDKLGDTCLMIVQTGMPCPQCGMTRSWVHAVRLDLIAAFFYSPSGVLLLGWINAAGFIGAVRLAWRDPRKLEPPAGLLVGWVLFWLVPVYTGSWVLRILGVNPLP